MADIDSGSRNCGNSFQHKDLVLTSTILEPSLQLSRIWTQPCPPAYSQHQYASSQTASQTGTQYYPRQVGSMKILKRPQPPQDLTLCTRGPRTQPHIPVLRHYPWDSPRTLQPAIETLSHEPLGRYQLLDTQGPIARDPRTQLHSPVDKNHPLVGMHQPQDCLCPGPTLHQANT